MASAPVAGILGWPVAHSLSPKLHNYWLKQYGIEGEYRAVPVNPHELARALKNMPAQGFCGFNLTIPHKEAAVGLLDSADALVKEIDAVNTVIIKDGKLHGTNTDAYGFAENIRGALPAQKKKAIVLGAGGAAKSVCKALLDLGFKKIIVLNRTHEKSEQLARQFKNKLTVAAWEKRSEILADADLLVNTTSLGMGGKDPLAIDLDALPKQALVTDIVYTPLMTPLLERAVARGNPIVDGLGMLLHQAVPAFEAWFGVRPEVNQKLRDYILDA